MTFLLHLIASGTHYAEHQINTCQPMIIESISKQMLRGSCVKSLLRYSVMCVFRSNSDASSHSARRLNGCFVWFLSLPGHWKIISIGLDVPLLYLWRSTCRYFSKWSFKRSALVKPMPTTLGKIKTHIWVKGSVTLSCSLEGDNQPSEKLQGQTDTDNRWIDVKTLSFLIKPGYAAWSCGCTSDYISH